MRASRRALRQPWISPALLASRARCTAATASLPFGQLSNLRSARAMVEGVGWWLSVADFDSGAKGAVAAYWSRALSQALVVRRRSAEHAGLPAAAAGSEADTEATETAVRKTKKPGRARILASDVNRVNKFPLFYRLVAYREAIFRCRP